MTTTTTPRQIMTQAHQIRREAAARFGGRPGDYEMSIALEMAWEQAGSTIIRSTVRGDLTVMAGRLYFDGQHIQSPSPYLPPAGPTVGTDRPWIVSARINNSGISIALSEAEARQIARLVDDIQGVLRPISAEEQARYAEQNRRARQWGYVVNEGGEGYNPHINY